MVTAFGAALEQLFSLGVTLENGRGTEEISFFTTQKNSEANVKSDKFATARTATSVVFFEGIQSEALSGSTADHNWRLRTIGDDAAFIDPLKPPSYFCDTG